jgi:alkylation response protein AidB-like acyl-CoA dehydrogenase
MDLLPNDDEMALTDVVRRYLADRAPVTAAPPAPPTPEMWKEWGELGWFGLAAPPELGGGGQGIAQETLVFRELGRVLLGGPLVATVVAAQVALAAGNQQLAASIIAGERQVAFAHTGPSGITLIDGACASHCLEIGDRAAVLRSVDVTGLVERPCADLSVTLHVGSPGPTVCEVALDHYDARSHALVLVSAALVGMAEATLEQSSSYAKVREQYGKPIGAYQAVSHRCADMATRADLAAMQTSLAGLSLDARTPDAAMQAVTAYLAALDAGVANAADNIQNHGGIGFTIEHPAYRYATRASVLSRLVVTKRAALDLLLPPV